MVLFCLLMSHKKEASLIWVTYRQFSIKPYVFDMYIYKNRLGETILIDAHNIKFNGAILKKQTCIIILIMTPGFPHFHYMLDANLGSFLYGDIPVMLLESSLPYHVLDTIMR